MTDIVAQYATDCQAPVARSANDALQQSGVELRMAQRAKKPGPPARIHRGKTPVMKHYLPEWAASRGKEQVDLVRDLGADKGTVSRWFSGVIPTDEYLEKIAHYFQWEDARTIFRHPDDDWITRLFQGREEEERKRMLNTLETAFPKRNTG